MTPLPPLSLSQLARALAGACALLAAPAWADLTIGVTPGALADSVQIAAAEARAEGQKVTVIEFSDWTTPNLALANGDLDLNYFQHQAFLNNALAETGYALTSVALGILPNIGLYSERYDNLDAIPQGARVAVASDPVNQGRGLALLRQAGLIDYPESLGVQAGVDDITANPRALQLIEIEGPQLVRAIADVDLAQGYPNHYVNAGRRDFARQALLYSGLSDSDFAIRFVARSDRAADAEIARFIALYQNSAAVRAQIHASNAEDSALYSLAWLN